MLIIKFFYSMILHSYVAETCCWCFHQRLVESLKGQCFSGNPQAAEKTPAAGLTYIKLHTDTASLMSPFQGLKITHPSNPVGWHPRLLDVSLSGLYSNCLLPIAHCQLRIENCELRIAHCLLKVGSAISYDLLFATSRSSCSFRNWLRTCS